MRNARSSPRICARPGSTSDTASRRLGRRSTCRAKEGAYFLCEGYAPHPIGIGIGTGKSARELAEFLTKATYADGAGSDFLSPIGHQSNTLVMGPGGYYFADYWKLGLPLSLIVVGIGAPLILIFWSLR